MYHFSTKPVSRGKGQSAVASASYRAGVKLEDKRTGKTFDYTKRGGLLFEASFDKKGKSIDRSELWNLAESSENRKDARVAREYVIALPYSLIEEKGLEEAINLSSHISLLIANKYDCAVDMAIHKPDKNGDNRNYHVHVLTTTRKFERTNDGIKLGDKTNIELSNKKLKEKGLPSTQEQIKELREIWSDTANQYLSAENKIDHRSYAEQGKDQLPTVKLGWKASDMERKGIKTERGDINRDIINRNKQIENNKGAIKYYKDLLSQHKTELEPMRVKKTDCGWKLYDNYYLLFNMHNGSIENLEKGYYTEPKAAKALSSFYEAASDVYGNIDDISKKYSFDQVTVKKMKESVDELTDNYTKFVNKTILKHNPLVTEAQEKATTAREKCFQLKPKPQAPKAEPSEQATIAARRLSF